MKQVSVYIWCMQTALTEAKEAFQKGEVPVGAVVLGEFGKVIYQTHNLKESLTDITAHAEILALKKMSKDKKNWRLPEYTLVVTLEPCPMCMSAIQQSRIKKVVFGAYDPKGGALSLGFNIHRNPKMNHSLEVVGGIMQYECSQILSRFFKERRGNHQ